MTHTSEIVANVIGHSQWNFVSYVSLISITLTSVIVCLCELIHRCKIFHLLGFYIPLCRSSTPRGPRGKSTNGEEGDKSL